MMLDIEQLTNKKIDFPQDQKQQYALLSQFCKELDPYRPLTTSELEILEFFNIQYTENPFELTNALLQKLMELEESLNEIS